MDYTLYESVCFKKDVRNFKAWFLPIMYSIICFVGLLGNGLVMLTYIYFKRLKTMTDTYPKPRTGASELKSRCR